MAIPAELQKRFGSYKARPKDAPSVAPVHRDMRGFFLRFADELDTRLPDGRYKDQAFDYLELASMLAHRSIEMELVD